MKSCHFERSEKSLDSKNQQINYYQCVYYEKLFSRCLTGQEISCYARNDNKDVFRI